MHLVYFRKIYFNYFLNYIFWPIFFFGVGSFTLLRSITLMMIYVASIFLFFSLAFSRIIQSFPPYTNNSIFRPLTSLLFQICVLVLDRCCFVLILFPYVHISHFISFYCLILCLKCCFNTFMILLSSMFKKTLLFLRY